MDDLLHRVHRGDRLGPGGYLVVPMNVPPMHPQLTVWPDCFMGEHNARHIFDIDARFAARSYAEDEAKAGCLPMDGRLKVKVRSSSGEVTVWRCVRRIGASCVYGPSEFLAVYEDLTDAFLDSLQIDALSDGSDPGRVAAYVPELVDEIRALRCKLTEAASGQ